MAADKKDVKVALTFDFDACCVWIGSLGAKSPSMISRGEFGPIALRRILDLLDRFGIKSTFFVPGGPRDTAPGIRIRLREQPPGRRLRTVLVSCGR